MDWYTYFNNISEEQVMNKDAILSDGDRRETSKRLGEILLEKGLIDNLQLSKALEVQRSLQQKSGDERDVLTGEILVELGFVKETDIAQVLSTQYRLPYFPASQYRINPEALRLVPQNIARRYDIMPLEKIGNCLTVAMANPLDGQAISELQSISHCSVHSLLSTASDIRRTIVRFYKN
jgi:type IV pilus assembly protein PilB